MNQQWPQDYEHIEEYWLNGELEQSEEPEGDDD